MARLARTIVAIALAAAAFVLLTGCPPAESPMEKIDWRLVGWSVSSVDPADVEITAAFANGQLSGSGGINRYNGPYTLGPGNAFSTGPLAATKMAGPEPAMRAEAAYFALLGQAASYKSSKQRLTLYDKGGNESLIFAAVKQ